MALDGITLNKVKEDLDRYLPIKINRIANTGKTGIVFNVHAGGVRTNLAMSFHSNYNHICLSDRNYNTYNEPSTFIMVLRKHILNGIIYQIEQFDHDRYLLFHIRARNELYDQHEYILSAELMGKYANLILVDEEGKIIDALKKIPPYENTRRTILPGAIFTLPEKQNKKDPYSCEDIDMDSSLVAQIAGFSRLLEDEVRFRMKDDSFEHIMSLIKASNRLYITSTPKGVQFHVIPLLHLSDEYSEWDIQKGFDEVYHEDDEKERIKNISDDLYKIVKRQIKHYTNKLDNLNASLEDALNLQYDKDCGDILYTFEDLDRKGEKQITLTGYDGKQMTVSLDPRYSIKDNANRYYARYQKKRKGKVFIEEQIQIAQSELDYFESLNEQLAIAGYDDALGIREELVRFGYLKSSQRKNRQKNRIRLYQLKIKDSTITFGKNNIQNSYLSFEYAHKDHIWLHAQGYHGSHVVIDRSDPDEEVLRAAANIAAWFSKGRWSSSVPVDYCPVKELKKIKGAKPGFVTFKNHRTIYIDPEEPASDSISLL